MLVTIIGGNGFIGGEIASYLAMNKVNYWIPEKKDPAVFKRNLGVVIYCAGNGECVTKPYEVMNANSSYLSEIVEKAIFERMIYFSSTRVYMGGEVASENEDLIIKCDDPRRLFNLSKLIAEEICIRSNRDIITIRPSNVYGLAPKSTLFLPSITKSAIINKKIDMFVDPTYAKDYVSVNNVVKIVYELVTKQKVKHNIYNVASGLNITANSIANKLCSLTGCDVIWHENKVTDMYPTIDIKRVKEEFGFEPDCVLNDLERLVQEMKLMFKNEIQ